MILWYLVLVLFAFMSYLIDINYGGILPSDVLRHIWNLLLFGLGVYLFVRMRSKAKAGVWEKMQHEYKNLSDDIEKKRFDKLEEKIAKLEKRIEKLEESK